MVGLQNALPPFTSYDYITKGLITTVPFTHFIISAFNEILQGLVKGKKQNSLERHSKHQNQTQILAGTLELSDHKFKTTLINMLWNLIKK